ncbi:hypothetical protein ACN38_g12790 [Penicillium nordicum]|uniref:Uncharacterized protein n=1 Tax=Penicillium nordicum TaxID=229535 RepID=A0A0M9W9J6_9EURO|nr:hypothetical protein ACN38_g12790 [Penicillium nordicum]
MDLYPLQELAGNILSDGMQATQDRMLILGELYCRLWRGKERKRETGYGLNYESCQTGSHAAPHGRHVISNTPLQDENCHHISCLHQ